MSKMYLLALFCLAWTMPFTATAQDRGKISLFGGYSYGTSGLDGGLGQNVSIAGNVINDMYLVADFSLFSKSQNYNWGSNKSKGYGFLFGPRFYTNEERWASYFHTLIGMWEDRWIRSDSLRGDESSSHLNRLAVDLGGGIDFQANKRISMRVFQFDVVGIRNAGHWNGFVKFTFGAVLHLNKLSNDL
jgi:hypothetical protein